jgi:hypothetical protein
LHYEDQNTFIGGIGTGYIRPSGEKTLNIFDQRTLLIIDECKSPTRLCNRTAQLKKSRKIILNHSPPVKYIYAWHQKTSICAVPLRRRFVIPTFVTAKNIKMPINKLALIRYKTIDNCLQNRFRKWTLEDLMEACADSLYEYEGITKGISRRSVQLDIQNMRSEKLGYNAPIKIVDKKYYVYEDKNFSITNIPLSSNDMGTLHEVVGILKQFKGFNYFYELTGIITRLEDKLYKQHKGKSYIEFEKNELLKGLNYIEPLHKAIINKKVVALRYKSFKSKEASEIIFHPYLLKEYRNRWFLLGINNKGMGVMNLALDRIEKIQESLTLKFVKPSFDIETYFRDVIGVSKMINQKTVAVILKIDNANAPYILTKPLHHSQKVLKHDENGMVFSIEVVWNYELEREILGFGEQMQVLGPRRLRSRIKSRHKIAMESYDTIEELS